MEQLGDYLKKQRELRQVDIRDISAETKIAVNWLQVIEEDMWDELPGKTFAKGYAKAYAKALGLDADDVISRYELMYAENDQIEVGDNIVKKTVKRNHPIKKFLPLIILLVLAIAALIIWLV